MRPPQSARGNVHHQVSVLRYKRPKTMRYWLHHSNNRHWMLYYLMEFLWSYCWWSLPRTLKLWPVEIYQWFGKSIYIKAFSRTIQMDLVLRIISKHPYTLVGGWGGGGRVGGGGVGGGGGGGGEGGARGVSKLLGSPVQHWHPPHEAICS